MLPRDNGEVEFESEEMLMWTLWSRNPHAKTSIPRSQVNQAW
jgi:hypothetical protein